MSFSFFELDALFQDPRANVPAIGRLGGGAVREDTQGHPLRVSGRHTVVYEMRTPSGRILALRVHQQPDRERDRVLAQRYIALQRDHLLDELRAPHGPLPSDLQWLPDGLHYRDADGKQSFRPLVAMERVPGRTLREMVKRLCNEGDTTHLAMIANHWLESALAMEAAGFIHGDLSPDNIMVRPDGTIAVIDLDTATWPGFHPDHDISGSNSALRHPQGVPRDPVHRDRFPALMLWASLRILAAQPELLSAGATRPAEGLLFSNSDIRRPATSPVFAHLDDADASLGLLLEVVRRAIRFSPEDLPPLAEIATRLDSLGFARLAQPRPGRLTPATRPKAADPETTLATDRQAGPVPSAPASSGVAAEAPPVRSATTRDTVHAQRLEALHAALQQRDGREALTIWGEVRAHPAAQVYAAGIHHLIEQEARSAIERALRRRDDTALLQAIARAESAGIAPDASALNAARQARRRAATRESLSAALQADDRAALANLYRTGQLEELGPLEPATNRALARARAWPSVEGALAADDDVAICAAADPAIWREEETHPNSAWLRLDLAWRRSRWAQEARAALRRRDGPYLRSLLATAPARAEERLTDVERRRVHRVITREQATGRLERALREGPDREVVEALAELEASGAPFSDGLDWSAVRGVVDRLSLADSLRAAMATEPPDTEKMARLLPAARAALGDLQSAGAEWAELEHAVLRAAHLERLREAVASGDDARIAAAADPDPFQVRELLAEQDALLVAAVLGRTRTQLRRHAP